MEELKEKTLADEQIDDVSGGDMLMKPMFTCPTCGKRYLNQFRRTLNGNVICACCLEKNKK